MKKLFQTMAVKTSTVPQTEEGSEFYQQEERLVETKNMYKQLLKLSRQMNAQLLASPAAQVELAAYYTQVGQKEDGLFGQTLLRSGDVLKSLAILQENLTFLLNEDFISPVTNTLINEIKTAKVIQKRLDDARLEFDSKRAKAASAKPGDARHQAEEELQVARQQYENLKSELTQKFAQVENLRQTDLIHNIAASMKAFQKYFADGNALLQELNPHFELLDEQVPRADAGDAKSVEVELKLLRLQRSQPQTNREIAETALQEEVRILQEQHLDLVELHGAESSEARAVVELAEVTRQRLAAFAAGSVA